MAQATKVEHELHSFKDETPERDQHRGKRNIIAGTDCGFGTAADRTLVSTSISWAKLNSKSDGAAIATKRLWG